MIIKQLSVFLENKTGRINDVVHTLGANGINMHAFSMAETADFGILRLIVSDVDKAVEVHIWMEGTDLACTDELKGSNYSIRLRFTGEKTDDQKS